MIAEFSEYQLSDSSSAEDAAVHPEARSPLCSGP